MSGILDTISGLFSGKKTENGGSANVLGDLLNSDLGKEVTSLLSNVKSFNPQEIQTVLSALSKSADKKVQSAKQDLQSVQHDGETFVEKLKGYLTQLPQLLTTLLPTLQTILSSYKK